MDRLYVEDSVGLTYGWADAATGETTIQIPGSEARVEAAFEAWALSFPEDDLALHAPGRNTAALTAAWDAEIAALRQDSAILEDMLRIATEQRTAFSKGMAGEYVVGLALNALHPQGWGVLHSIPVFDGRSDIDHLLVGPGGVWTVNAKLHANHAVRVNGDRMSVGRSMVDYVGASRREAQLVTRVLKEGGFDVPAHSAIALELGKSGYLTVVTAPHGVLVGTTSEVVAALRLFSGELERDTIYAIFAHLRQRQSWETTP